MIPGLSERLKLMRNQKKLTQEQVAKRLHVSPSIISAYETGDRTPSLTTLIRIAALYQCSTDYILGLPAQDPTSVLLIEGLGSNQIRALQYVIESMKNPS
jgi:transcriptional regulator with XRE-family HTH domain